MSEIEKGTAAFDYQEWKDVYDPEGDMDHGDFKHTYVGRTRYETVIIDKGVADDGGRLIETARRSEYDPYDYRYKGGFLRA